MTARQASVRRRPPDSVCVADRQPGSPL